MGPRSKVSPPKPPVGMSKATRDSTLAGVGLQRALDHIDRIYGEKILYAYGCGILIGLVNDEFDKFLALEKEKPKDAASLFSTLFGSALDIISAIPPLSLPIKLGKTAKALISAATTTYKHVQENYERATTVVTAIVAIEGAVKAPSDAPAETKGSDAYMREGALKFPLVQKAIAATYLLQYEKLDARKAFLDRLAEKIADDSFAGTPESLALDIFGPAPAALDEAAIFAKFADARERLFKEIMKAYVKREVVLLKSIWNDSDARTTKTYWLFYSGLNEAQWEALYARFGTHLGEADRQRILMQVYAHKMTKAFKMLSPAFQVPVSAEPEPYLNELSDLTQVWGARSVSMSSTSSYHGLWHTTDNDMVPR